MTDKIKKAMENISVSEEAQKRMYENIMKKAEKENKKSKPVMIYRTAGLAAACVAVICAAAAVGKLNADSENIAVTETAAEYSQSETSASSDGYLAVSPFGQEYTLDDIKAAGLDITLPDGAEVAFCNIWEDGQLDVRFVYNNHTYYYSASEAEGDFSGIYGTVSESENISEADAVLETTYDGYFKSRWSGEKYNYCFSNSDSANKEDMISLIKLFAAQAQ